MARSGWTGLALIGVVLWAGCGGDDDPTPTGTITMTVTPMSIDDLGGTAMVAVDVKDAAGVAATGAVSIGASAGGFQNGSGSGVIKTLVDGKATAIFSCSKALDADCTGTVTFTAAWNAARATGSLMITPGMIDAGVDAAIVDAEVPMDRTPLSDAGVPQLSWVSTRCNGNNCTIMGIRNSGFNEISQVTFRLTDSLGAPIEGATIRFSINLPPSGTVVTATGVTNAGGDAFATVNSGLLIGVFSVTATYIPGLVETSSPSIGIRGAKAANRGFQISCSRVNIGAYVSPTPPRVDTATCRIFLNDRYGNPVGTGTSVNLKSEAGTVPNSVPTKAYDSMGNNADEGVGTFMFSTAGNWPALDVDPLPALPGQYPIARDPEPFQTSGALVRNPRDGLVTMMAYLRGEEWFSDDNTNGVRDNNEAFIDQGEAFVDRDDNGVRNNGETFIDDAPANGSWDGPNGVWDADTTISTEIRMMYSDRPASGLPTTEVTPAAFSGPCGAGLPKGATQDLSIIWGDMNFNPPQVENTVIGATHVATKGGISSVTTALLDGYGHAMERLLVNAADGTGCLPSTPICRWRFQFTRWRFITQLVRVTGASTGDMTACQEDIAQPLMTVLGGTVLAGAPGAIQ